MVFILKSPIITISMFTLMSFISVHIMVLLTAFNVIIPYVHIEWYCPLAVPIVYE